jgi:hypothetical protein
MTSSTRAPKERWPKRLLPPADRTLMPSSWGRVRFSVR